MEVALKIGLCDIPEDVAPVMFLNHKTRQDSLHEALFMAIRSQNKEALEWLTTNVNSIQEG